MTSPTDNTSAEPGSLPRWAPAAIFALLTVVVFAKYIFSPAGTMLIGNDTIAAGVMMRKFFVEEFHKLGRLPLWNPYMYGGVPTIEAGSGDILYPPSFILHMALPLVSALAWKLILHVFLAGFTMYGCARAFGASRLVSLFAGVTWMLSANLVSLVLGGQDGKMYVITLFPAALGLLVSAISKPSAVRFIWFGAVAGLLLTAHPQVSFYAWVALGSYALVSIALRRGEGTRLLGLRLAGGVLSLAIALGVALIVLLPMYRYLRDVSPRAGPGLSFETAASYSLNPEEMVNFVVPEFSGDNETYWGRNPLKHNTEYGGVLAFALGIAGLIALKGDRRRIGLGIMAGVSLLYALGATTPAFKLMYLTIPGLKRFRAPSLATFLALTSLVILAALLLERILKDREAAEVRTTIRVVGGFGIFALLLAIVVQVGGAGALGPWNAIFGAPRAFANIQANLPRMTMGGIFAAVWCGLAVGVLVAWRNGLLGATGVILALSGITAVDLLRVDFSYIQVAPYSSYFPEDPGLDALRQQLGPGERVLPLPMPPGVFPTGGPEGGFFATYLIPETFGYHSNQLRWYDQLTRRSDRDSPGSEEGFVSYWHGLLASPVARVLGARVVVVSQQLVPFVMKDSIPGYQSIGRNQQVAIYRNTSALPNASVIPGIRVEPDSVKRLGLLWDPGFDVSKEVLVDAPVSALGAGGGTGTAKLVDDGPDSVAIEATTTGPSMLMLSRTFHPAWKATVDGAPVAALRVNHALIGVPLEKAGTHAVSLSYRPAIVAEAKLVTTFSWIIVIVASVVSWGMTLREKRRRV